MLNTQGSPRACWTGRAKQSIVKPGEKVVLAAHFANPCTGKEFTVEMHHFISESGRATVCVWGTRRGLCVDCDVFLACRSRALGANWLRDMMCTYTRVSSTCVSNINNNNCNDLVNGSVPTLFRLRTVWYVNLQTCLAGVTNAHFRKLSWTSLETNSLRLTLLSHPYSRERLFMKLPC